MPKTLSKSGSRGSDSLQSSQGQVPVSIELNQARAFFRNRVRTPSTENRRRRRLVIRKYFVWTGIRSRFHRMTIPRTPARRVVARFRMRKTRPGQLCGGPPSACWLTSSGSCQPPSHGHSWPRRNLFLRKQLADPRQNWIEAQFYDLGVVSTSPR
jgi:hypothetical protein